MSRRQDFETAISPYRGINVSSKKIQRLLAIRPTNIITQMIRIDINGTQFVLRRSTCIRIPRLCGLLTSIAPMSVTAALGTAQDKGQNKTTQQGPKDMLEFTFEKSSQVFAAVVDYVQNHELHAPHLVCPKLFARDLRFWGFDVDELAQCCYARVLRFLYKEEKLEEFHGFLKRKSRHPEHWLERTNSSAAGSRGLTCFQWIRISMWTFLENPFENRAARIYFFVTVFSVLGCYLTACAETLEIFSSSDMSSSKNTTMTWTMMMIIIFIRLDQVCIGLQCLDLLVRMFFYPDPIRFLCNVVNLTDGLAAMAAIVKLALPILFDCDPNQFLYKGCGQALQPYLYVIYILQLLRIMRILRPLSQVMQFRLLYYTLKSSLSELCLVFLLLALLSLVFATMIYYLGSKKAIPNIFEALWYSIITLTTVGYGDVVPDDWVSRVLGCAMAVLGVIVLAVTTPIFVSNFRSLYLHAVVGQPSTIRRLQHKLGMDIQKTASGTARVSKSSPTPELDQRLRKRRRRACDWCTRVCCRRSSCRKRVFPQEEQHINGKSRTSVREVVDWQDVESDPRQRKTVKMNLSDSEQDFDSEKSLLTLQSSETNSPVADSEGEAEAGSSPTNAFSIKVFQKHQNMLQPRRRSWYDNYNTTTSDESGRETPTPVIRDDTGEKCTRSPLDGQADDQGS